MQLVAIIVTEWVRQLKLEARAMPSKSKTSQSKPRLVLVHEPSLWRGFLETSLKNAFDLKVFSVAADAFDYAKSTKGIDILVTELDVGSSPLGGCNVARTVKLHFPDCWIYVFSSARAADHRLATLSGLSKVTVLTKPLDVFFLPRRIREALATGLER